MNRELLTSLCKSWPQIADYLPEADDLLDCQCSGSDMGFCTYPRVADKGWFHSRGGKMFVCDANVPAQFFWLGVINRGGSEYLFLMWHRAGRRFWFYDQYVVFASGSDASVERTRGRLATAFERWERADVDVVFSGSWGWYDLESGRFEKEPLTDRRDGVASVSDRA